MIEMLNTKLHFSAYSLLCLAILQQYFPYNTYSPGGGREKKPKMDIRHKVDIPILTTAPFLATYPCS